MIYTVRLAVVVFIVILSLATFSLPRAALADHVRDRQWHLGALNVDIAHTLSKGSGVVVAVIDTGVDPFHPDLKKNVLQGTDFVELGGDGFRDLDGHGTAMAGLIAAHGHGSNGVLGIAPESKVLPIRVGKSSHWFAIDAAVDWAVKAGANVINISGGGQEQVSADRKAIGRALSADVVVVAAVGNTTNGDTARFPAGYPGVLAVGGVNRDGTHLISSAIASPILISAPADDLVSVGLRSGIYVCTGGSGAAALVSGAAALVRARYPRLTAQQVVNRLTRTAVDKGAPGRDAIHGYGMLDVGRALANGLPGDASILPSRQATSISDALQGWKRKIVTGLLLLTVLALVSVPIFQSRRIAES